ncbi:MAG: amidohydrolase family protein [Acidimicrobiia bacterium]|nr:amidohydrolase family protein [Acidimicrobiia bacterium]
MGDDVVLVNGRIWTGRGEVSAVGIRDGRVAAAGESGEVRDRLGNDSTVVDVEGRRVIPGLIDSHIHVVRAGLTWNQTVRWDDIADLETGLGRVREAAGSAPPGTWIRVLGGWHPGMLAEGRGPTRRELDKAGGDHPVYVQLLYEEGVLNGKGLKRLQGSGWDQGLDLDDRGEATGRISGAPAFRAVLSLFEEPSLDESIEGTEALMSDLLSHGVTGVVDPGGFGMTPQSYDALFRLWRNEKLPLRVRCGPSHGGQ